MKGWDKHAIERVQQKIAGKPKYQYIIGIDAGVNTGFACWHTESKKLLAVETIMIHQALDRIRNIESKEPKSCFVRIEDARLATFDRQGETNNSKQQGAGSIKRDAKIWEDAMKDWNIDFEMVRPNNKITKLDQRIFEDITGWKGRTSNHGRDAAMLVFNYKP